LSPDVRLRERTAKSCGPGAPMLAPSLRGRNLEGDGGYQAGTPGRARIRRKPPRRECRNVRRTCHDLRACSLPFCTQGCGCVSASGIPCASVLQGARLTHHPGISCRGNADAHSTRCRHSGARRSREPGIHTRDRGSGFSDVQWHIIARRVAAPRNDEEAAV